MHKTNALFRLGFPMPPRRRRLSLLYTLSPRPIMQEVRRHTIKVLRPLVSNKFQVLFHSPNRGAFHHSLTVLFTIGRYRVFSLMPWSAHIHTTFHVCGATLEFPRLDQIFEYKTFTFCGSSFQRILLIITIPCWSPNPDLINQFGLGWSLFARHY